MGNQTFCTLLAHFRHAFIRATTRPIVRTETPNILAHLASLLPRRNRCLGLFRPCLSVPSRRRILSWSAMLRLRTFSTIMNSTSRLLPILRFVAAGR